MVTQEARTTAQCARWWHRPAAVLLGLALFGAIELICAWFGWGTPPTDEDPFVSFKAVQPLFVREPGRDRLHTAPSRRKFFPQQSFAWPKPPGTFRVFCFGGSTVQGNPYAEDTAFPKWFEISLQAAAPERSWEVINCGGISYASYRLANLVEECLQYEPDLFILCTGHNEFLEDRTYARLKQTPGWLIQARRGATRLRTFNLLETAARRASLAWQRHAANSQGNRSVLPEEVDAWLDYEGGLQVYHRDEAWHSGVVAHFQSTLLRMIGLSQNAGVPFWLVTPTSNLRDCPPFKSQHRDGMTADDLRAWSDLMDSAVRVLSTEPRHALELLEQAADLDDAYAFTAYQRGRTLDALHRPGEAKQAYLKARELDVCPLRILSPMEEAIRQIAADKDTPWIDAQGLIAARSPDGIPGDEWLVDHVHPSIEGHQVIAEALMTNLVRQIGLTPMEGWESQRDRAYANHLAELRPDYYQEGERALEGLRAWTEGRASGPSIAYWLLGHSPKPGG